MSGFDVRLVRHGLPGALGEPDQLLRLARHPGLAASPTGTRPRHHQRKEYRDEMVNLQRWRLEQDLGYVMTARIAMRMPSGLPIYDMVFATDHPVGNKIMTDLYRKAAEREPLMRQEAKAKAKDKRSRDAGLDTLFDLPATSIPVESLAWEPTDSWDPATRSWWHQEPDFPA
jgi:hypothetical protein